MSYGKSEKTRKRLMETMSRLLQSQGFHATGIQQILMESGIPKGSLYYHFPQGKAELAAGSVGNSAEIVAQILSEIIFAESDPVEALRIFCDFYIEELERESFTLGCPIATITLEAAATNDQIYQACKAGFEKMSTGFINLLEGRGIPAQRASELATFALASIEGALILCKARRSTEPLVIIRDHLMSQVAIVVSES